MAIKQLHRAFTSRYGTPVITEIDTAIFTRKYFTHCMSCRFCHDACCQYGVDVDLTHYEAIRAHADALEAYTGIPRDLWFTEEWEASDDYPGGTSTRTQVVDGACVFLDRKGRGCKLHGYCLHEGIPYQELKSIIDCLFPLTVTDEVLAPADEVDDRTLVCVGTGETLYRGLRGEVKFYFGDVALAVLDRLESQSVALMEHDNSTRNSQDPTLER